MEVEAAIRAWIYLKNRESSIQLAGIYVNVINHKYQFPLNQYSIKISSAELESLYKSREQREMKDEEVINEIVDMWIKENPDALRRPKNRR